MRDLMPQQRIAPTERSATHRAPVRLLTRMHAHVDLHIRLSVKRFRANFAREHWFARRCQRFEFFHSIATAVAVIVVTVLASTDNAVDPVTTVYDHIILHNTSDLSFPA